MINLYYPLFIVLYVISSLWHGNLGHFSALTITDPPSDRIGPARPIESRGFAFASQGTVTTDREPGSLDQEEVTSTAEQGTNPVPAVRRPDDKRDRRF
ncbi:hypothetical protein FXW78_26415 [Rhodococcus opacus]|nr:hypothetical protein [Rhodococcus opacus]